MDWRVRFETDLFKIYYRQVSILALELVELGSFVDRFEREGERVVSIVLNIGATETGLLLTGASGVNGHSRNYPEELISSFNMMR